MLGRLQSALERTFPAIVPAGRINQIVMKQDLAGRTGTTKNNRPIEGVKEELEL